MALANPSAATALVQLAGPESAAIVLRAPANAEARPRRMAAGAAPIHMRARASTSSPPVFPLSELCTAKELDSAESRSKV